MTEIADIVVDLCGNDFLLPYIEREMGVDDESQPQSPIAGIRIMTDEAEGCVDEGFDTYCQDRLLPVAVLRCPYIVATGMTGLMRKIAGGIYRGTYVNIRGNEAHISVVHGTDVARAVRVASGIQGTYTLTDTTDPKISDLADAFAYRMQEKRVIAIKPRWARWWYGRRYYHTLTTDHLAVPTFTQLFPDFKPVEVTNYLRTHVYDQHSL